MKYSTFARPSLYLLFLFTICASAFGQDTDKPVINVPDPFTSSSDGLRWEREEFGFSIPALDSSWSVEQILSLPPQEDPEVAREQIAITANSGQTRFELMIWDKQKGQSLKKWYRTFGRGLVGTTGVTVKKLKTPEGEKGIWVNVEASYQAPQSEVFFVASRSQVISVKYINEDGGVNREAFKSLCLGLSARNLGVSLNGSSTQPIGPPAESKNNKVYECGGVFDTCPCNNSNPYPCCSNGSNCTWGAWHLMCCEWAYGPGNWGNAETWAENAKAVGNWVQPDPTVGSVACRLWAPDTPYGHVAYVRGIVGDYVDVQEMNCEIGGAGYVYTRWHKTFFTGGYITRTQPTVGTPVTTLAGWYRILTSYGKVFDVQGGSTSDGAQIQQYTWNGTAAQVFRFDHLGDGWYKIINKKSGKAIDIDKASLSNGAKVQQWTSIDSDAQRFRVEDLGNGYLRFVAKHSGKVLDVTGGSSADGTKIQQYGWADVAAQKFRVETMAVPVTNLSGEYKIIRKGTTDKVLDVYGGSLDNGANIQLWTANGTAAQIWVFSLQSDNYYKITCKKSGKAVDVSSNSTADGANVHQWTWGGGNNQRWRVEDLGDGHYRFVAKHSNKVLDCAKGGSTAGTNVQQYTWNGTVAQRWKIVR